MALSIEIAKGEPGTYSVKLSGQLDTETAEQLGIRMEEVWADAKARAIRMDLHDLTYISSMGLGILAKIKYVLKSRGGAVVVVGMQPQIARAFEIARILPKEIVFATREEADAYLAAIEDQVRNP